MSKKPTLLLLAFLSCLYVNAQCGCTSSDTINQGLVACYPFNGNANDQTLNNNHGVVSGATLTTDRFGNPNSAYYFDGVNDGIEVARSSSLEPSFAMSACAWVYKESSSNAWTPILSKRYSIPDPYNSYSMDGGAGINQRWMVNICKGTVGSQRSVFSNMARPYNQWEFLVMVYDGVHLKMYINGIEENKLSVSGAIGYSSLGFYIGKNTVYDQFFKGKIDDVRIYNRALSSCEVRYLYNNCNGQYQSINLIQDTIKTICRNDSIQLIGQNALYYSWTPSTGLSNPNISNPIASPKVTTLYHLVAGDSACTYEDKIWVVVKNEKLTINRGERICPGDSVQLKVTGALSYLWQSNLTLSDINIGNPYAKPQVSTTYYVSANINGCNIRDSVTVVVANDIIADAGPDVSACKGEIVNLFASGGSRFVWSPNLEISDTTIRDPKIYSTQSRWYKLYTSSGLCESTDSLFITINDKPTLDLNDTTICGVNNVFTPNVKSTLADSYLWQPSTYLSTNSVQYPLISPKATIKYFVTAKNMQTNCNVTDSFEIRVGNVKADFSPSNRLVIVPEQIQLNNNSSPSDSYFSWFIDDLFFTDNANPELNIAEPREYNIKLIVEDSLGCIDSVTKIVVGKRNQSLFIPNIFSPNNDQVNDLFVINFDTDIYQSLNGSIWNRWGAKLGEFDGKKGVWWDGKSEGSSCPDGVYFYIINSIDISGGVKTYQGTITIMR